MTNKEAIEVIRMAIAQVQWDWPMDYAAAFDKAIESLELHPVAKGRWERPEPDGVITYDQHAYAQCSACKKKSYLGRPDNFCRHCGANMTWRPRRNG